MARGGGEWFASDSPGLIAVRGKPSACKRLDINSFKDYISLYTGTEDVQIARAPKQRKADRDARISDAYTVQSAVRGP